MDNLLGITIQEGIANGLTLDAGVSTRNVGILFERERGVPNKATLFTSPNEDLLLFGGADRNMFGSFTVDLIFKNSGGNPVNIYGIRIVGAGCAAASATLTNGAAETPSDLVTFKAGRQGQQDVGTWGNNLKVKLFPSGNPQGLPSEILAEVYYKNVRVEKFQAATLTALVDQMNNSSNYVMCVLVDGTKNFPAIVTLNLTGGVYVAPEPEAFEPSYDEVTFEPKGLALFEGVDAQILCCPEVADVDFQSKCDAFAKDKKKFYVFNMPYLATETNLQSYHTVLVTPDRSHTASYLEWAEIDDKKGGRIWVPAIGYFIGAGYLKTAALNNDAPWTPPAGMDTKAVGIYRFSHENLNEQTLDRYAKKWCTNATKFIRNRGTIIWSSRTYSSTPLFHSIHVSLMTNWLIESLLIRRVRFLQRLNTPSMRNEIKVDSTIFMKNVYDMGGLESSIPFERACQISVETDAANRKNLNETINWIPTENTESITTRLNRNDGELVVQG